jgi:hypothetical protein
MERKKTMKSVGERMAFLKGWILCVVGILFFPSGPETVNKDHADILRLSFHRKALAPAMLAHLYRALSSWSVGINCPGSVFLFSLWAESRFKCGPSKTISPSPFLFRDCLLFHVQATDRVKILRGNRRTVNEWRADFDKLLEKDFIWRPFFASNCPYHFQGKPGLLMYLIGADDFVAYNAHRCMLQIGRPRSEIRFISPFPPVMPRSRCTEGDVQFIRLFASLWVSGAESSQVPPFIDPKGEEGLTEYLSAHERLIPSALHQPDLEKKTKRPRLRCH